MKSKPTPPLAIAVAALALLSGFAVQLQAADSKDEETIKEVMKSYHKAPKGTDPVCKKASNGQASKEELAKLVAGYRELCDTKPPKGDAASWKEKTKKLLAAAESLEKGTPGGLEAYKEAVNCKACHSTHKPE
ncbi:MAG TPA: hypothetical protein DCM86_14550 [Verrucomicrobiales bacterium]|nr:hypothetical protein [Verrucomicrobiales bacterium]